MMMVMMIAPPGLLKCAQIWYRVWSRHSRYTTNVHGQRSNVKITRSKVKVTA